ncbi:MAG TPA: hypothetical protein VF740_12220, partial [Candidatus Acidoferrum sp.]
LHASAYPHEANDHAADDAAGHMHFAAHGAIMAASIRLRARGTPGRRTLARRPRRSAPCCAGFP